MYLITGLLVVIILILVVMFVKNKPQRHYSRQWDCINKDTGDLVKVQMRDAKRSGAPEKASLRENSEYFTECASNEAQKSIDCGADDKFEYAVYEFGAPGMSYKDWVASQAVDPQVIANHAEFVKDRSALAGGPQNLTGRTYSPDSHQSDQIVWQGLRRPEAVATCNPDQVPDVDYSWYRTTPSFTWKSGTGEGNQ